MKTVDGRQFECLKCGDCCRWDGKVYLTDADIDKLAAWHAMPVVIFVRQFTDFEGGRTVLKNKPESNECIFMDGNKCGVWGTHPDQCDEWPKKYDNRCPGFINGESCMNYKEAVERVNKKFSEMREWDQAVSDRFYKGLIESSKEASVASKALLGGVDPYSKAHTVKVASIDDLFAFHRASDNHLIHKATRDLWSIETSDDGGVKITRLFDNEGEPIKG